MGLDMYLNKKRYVGYVNNTEVEVTYTGWNNEVTTSHYKNVNYIIQEVGYWRKANQIHKWFVDNCCNGEDDCSPHYFPFEKLLELKELCQKVLNAMNSEHLTDGEKAEICEELLPTCTGFFFGTYEYDDWYKKDLEQTVQIIENVEKDFDKCNDSLYYEASW